MGGEGDEEKKSCAPAGTEKKDQGATSADLVVYLIP